MQASLVVGVAVLVRTYYFFDIRLNPFFLSPVIDANFYHELARSLAIGQGTGEAPFMMPPLFPVLLAFLYKVFGVNLPLAHVIQLGLGVATSWITFELGRRVFRPSVGFLAGLLVATNQALLFVEGDLLATPLAVCLDLLFLLSCVLYHQSGRRLKYLLLGGLVFALCILVRPSVAITLPFVLFWIWRRSGQRRTILLFLLCCVLPVLPVTIHNYRATREFIPVSANGGINFYIGNNPDMRDSVDLRPGPDWRAMNDLPLREAGIVLPEERDRWFYRRGLEFWQQQPLLAIKNAFQKAMLVIHNHEIMRDYDYYYFASNFSKTLRLPWWNFASLLSLAMLGLIFARPKNAESQLLTGFTLFYALGIVLFFVTARYRAPLLPILNLYAALGITFLWRERRQLRRQTWVLCVLVASAVYTISVVDFWRVDGIDQAEAHYRVATAYESKGERLVALKGFEAALELNPAHKLAAARAAGIEAALGRLQEAVVRYERIIDDHPNYVEPMIKLAQLAELNGQDMVVRDLYSMVRRRDPYFAQGHGYWGLYLLRQGENASAIQSLLQALKHDPAWVALRPDLARAYLRTGDPAHALPEIERALRVMPPTGDFERLYGDALYALDRRIEAGAAWRRGLTLSPNNTKLRARVIDGKMPAIAP